MRRPVNSQDDGFKGPAVSRPRYFERTGPRRALIAVWLMVLVAIVAPSGLSAQSGYVDRENKIKAAYLFQFIRYVNWPSDAFSDQDSPLVIGVIGNDPVSGYLRLISQKRTAGKRKLVYRQVSNVSEARACHILFVSDSGDSQKTESIVRSLRHAPVLIVGESSGFVDNGGVIALVTVNNRVRLQLSMTSASMKRLDISSQLAKLAHVVD